MATDDASHGLASDPGHSPLFVLTLVDQLSSSQRLLSFFLNGYLTLFLRVLGPRPEWDITLTAWNSTLLISAFFLYCLPTLLFGRVVSTGFYSALHPITYFLANASHTAISWIVLALTVDRFLVLCFPLSHQTIGKRIRVKRLMWAVSLMAVVFSLPRFFEVTTVYECSPGFPFGNTSGGEECERRIERTALPQNGVYWAVYHIVLSALFVTIAPCLMLFVLTCRISFCTPTGGKSLCNVTSAEYSLNEPRGSGESGRLRPNDQRANLIYVLVIAKFLISDVLPTVVDVLEHAVGDRAFMSSPLASLFVDFSNFLLVLNASSNFWVFFFFGRRFRQTCIVLLFGGRCGGAFAKLLPLDSDLSSRTRRQSSVAVPLLSANRVKHEQPADNRRSFQTDARPANKTRATSCT
ncbi:G-PROTEIN-RECEP-F1-2 domain-containing protein [Aphelenchoides fujianensis]|nr:G-PROTEIN-RECEP-F1-2 domain-containing protein [Aphelenchoides fujianensis]